ncbi:hypothetical protein KQI86_07325 [Clostridium sp. MSJ-11]|uniref:Uncharacterized protein n=1 Tax=Clostridium mobile TaxID=2841512 RepID=A0ABS6EG64_9CLOT|nr:hypothetical protein [Clostridium mobile]MBU5484137.1 hypothetical protein [Clostridium mobile]
MLVTAVVIAVEVNKNFQYKGNFISRANKKLTKTRISLKEMGRCEQ